MFIGVFGIINLLNTLITNVLTRKRELGVLQAVGLSGKQLSNMLLMEGVFYTICVLILSILFGTVVVYELIILLKVGFNSYVVSEFFTFKSLKNTLPLCSLYIFKT